MSIGDVPPPQFTVEGRPGGKAAELWFIDDPSEPGKMAIDLRVFVPTGANAAMMQFMVMDALREIVQNNDEQGGLDVLDVRT